MPDPGPEIPITRKGRIVTYARGISKLSAFTLLELLVVMSIISLLMSILLPSLRKVRETGKRAVCLSNLRQFNIAWTSYALENNDKICAADTLWNGIQPWDGNTVIGGYSHFWVSDGPGAPYNDFCGTETAIKNGVLWPYVENLELYKCPSDEGGFVRSYSILHAMGSIHNLNGERNFYRTSEINTPSQKGVFIDVELHALKEIQMELWEVLEEMDGG